MAHYLVHSYDYPPLAANGLDAAERFAAIAPAAPHALHMPAHIFTRLGYWQESIETNRASKQTNPTDSWHAMDYMMYGYLQLAQDEAARAVLEEVQAAEEVNNPRLKHVGLSLTGTTRPHRDVWPIDCGPTRNISGSVNVSVGRVSTA